MIERLLSEALEKRFQEEDLKDCYLVDIVVGNRDKVEVFIESDGELSFQTCKKVSRFLEHLIEEKRLLGERYTLDVSSPGIGRPLKLQRQYVKNIGRKIRITDKEGKKIEGKLIHADETTLKVETETGQVEDRSMEDIETAKILVSFK
jgi:ribosome maturation factor RimP